MAEPPVHLVSAASRFEAHVIKARLESEGLDPELRGATEGPYVFTVGGMAEVGVYVPPEQLDDARLVLLATEVDTSVGADRERPATRWTRGDVAALVLVLLMMLLITVGRLLSAT